MVNEDRSILGHPVQVLGETLSKKRFGENQDRSISGDIQEIKQLPPTIPFDDEEQAALFAGPLSNSMRVCFVTVLVDSTPVSYGLIVDLADSSDPRVARFFDPTAFKDFAEQLRAAEREGQGTPG